MKRFLIIGLILSAAGLHAQVFPQDNWYVGEVTLTTGDTKKGVIKYDLTANSIQINSDDRTETYHANQFYTFQIFMKKEKIMRYFYVLPHANESGYKRPTIFELIYEGKISLLAREYIATRSINNSSGLYGNGFNDFTNPYSRTFRQQYLAFKLFLVDNQGRITVLNSKKNDVVAALGNHQKEMKRFIKDKKLKMDNVMDMAELIEFYNQVDSI